MALNERYLFFDSVDEDNRDYNSADFARYFRKLFTNGVFRGESPLLASADGLTLNLGIQAGSAMINGRYYELTEDGNIALTVRAADMHYYLVLRLNLATDARTITLQLKEGTTSAPPELQRDDSVWELAVASIFMPTGQTYISASNVVDLRSDGDLCGYVQNTGDPAFYPPTELPELLWLYTVFPETLTAEQRSAVEGNPSLIAKFSASRVATAAQSWELIQTYDAAGAYNFTVPDLFDGDNYDLGVLMVGAGGRGGAITIDSSNFFAAASGGASGELKQLILKTGVDAQIGEIIPAVVGAKGTPATTASGGSSSFDGITVEGGAGGGTAANSSTTALALPAAFSGGQKSDAITTNTNRIGNTAPFGGEAVTEIINAVVWHSRAKAPQNIFDPSDTHIYCGAGAGACGNYNNGSVKVASQSVIPRTKGSAGAAYVNTSSGGTGGNATAPGDGGGASVARGSVAGGNGADGLILIYARRARA